MSPTVPVALVRWEQILDDLLTRTEKFPKRARFTFAVRIEDLALGVLDALVQARWARDKSEPLALANRDLERLRVFLRLAHARGFLPHEAYERTSRDVDECGRMIGGWIRHDAGGPAAPPG